MLKEINRSIELHKDLWLDELARLVRAKSISGTGEGVDQCAELFAQLLNEAGVDAKVMRLDGCETEPPFPFVVGTLRAEDENAPTFLIYGHYDVKPAGDLALWKTDPFEACIIGDRMYGRGVSDNKCQIFEYIKAVQICRELTGKVPCSLKFIFEGSEEIGSPGLTEFLRQNKELLKADFCLNSDGAMHESCRPTLKLGTKGFYAPTIEIQYANRDVHSMHGPTVPNPAWRMAELLNTLRDFESGYVKIDGFYDDVRPASPEELQTLNNMPNDGAVTLKELDLDHFAMGPHGDDYNYNFVFEPSCNINSLVSGHVGPGSNNIVPYKASCRIDFRLVPDQDPADIHEKFLAHLKKHGFDDVRITEAQIANKPVRIPVTNPYVRVIIDALRDAYGKEPIVYPNGGGSGPLSEFAESVGVETAILPLCAADQCEHAPNENMKLEDFENGLRACTLMMLRLGEMNK